MAQIAFVQPVAPQPPPPGPPASGEQQQFSPHFDKAIARRRDQAAAREGDIKAGDRTTESTEKPRSTGQPATRSAGNDGSDSPPVAAAETAAEGNTLERDVPPGQAVSQPDLAEFAAPQPSPGTGSPMYFFPPGRLPGLDSLESLQLPAVSPNPTTGEQEAGTASSPLAPPVQDSLAGSFSFSPARPEPSIPAGQTPVVMPGMPPAGDALLRQIQQLIDSSDETGTVSITAAGNTRRAVSLPSTVFAALAAGTTADSQDGAVPAAGDAGEVDGAGPMLAIAQGLEAPAAKGSQSPASLRHSTDQQYFEARIDLQQGGENDAASQDGRQGNEFGQQTGASPGPAAPAGVAGEQTNTFAQPLAVAQEGQTPAPAGESARPLTLPSGATVQQDEVVQQVIERFHLARRTFDTQINIKLHPAELGEVNVNLSVKEGAIRANVVAQSQHVQEIIEKNMGKLRTVLENQGFTIEEMTVTAKSDAVGDFNLFDRQLFSQSDYSPPSSSSARTPGGLFTLEEDPGRGEQAATAGVNVKI